MIAMIEGTVIEKNENEALLMTAGGVGYRVMCSVNTLSLLPAAGDSCRLHTYLNVREDAMELFGFGSKDEKDMFKRLISVSGIGAKSALAVLGSMPLSDLRLAILTGDAAALSRAPGIGKKTAQRISLELKDKLTRLLVKHGYHVKAIEVMDASRRTTKSNAYFTGFGKMKTIVLYDNLLNAMTPDEICAVFAHELGHGLHKDVLKQQIMNLGNLLLMAIAVWLTVREPAMHEAFGFAEVNYGFAFVLLGGLLGLIQPLTGMAMNAYSRHAEYRADAQAVKEGYGEALIGGLKQLAKENFSNLAPSKALVVLEYSHPPLSERIAAIEKK